MARAGYRIFDAAPRQKCVTERIICEVVGRGGSEPPTPRFSVGPRGPNYEPPSSHIVDNQADSGR